MTEPGAGAAPATAGALLRAAREKQGLHIAALAAAIKVAPRKLDALEHDRYDELPDATFTRALAQTVCRTLKVDPQPVLALLPQPDTAALDTVAGSLNAPFRERPMRDDGAGIAAAAIRPMTWAGLVLLIAAAAVYFVPTGTWQRLVAPAAPVPAVVQAPVVVPVPDAAPIATAASVAAPAADAASAAAPAALVETVHSAPPPDPAASPAAVPRLVMLRSADASWIEARDVRGQVLFSRVVQPGESVGFDGALPIRLTIGNAPATQLSFRGKVVDLAPSTRENVARIELQ
jgi:cytoskeleton protein RodZ